MGRATNTSIPSGRIIIAHGLAVRPIRAPRTCPIPPLAAAVGRPDAYAGELPVCQVELRPGSDVSEDELRHFAEQEISERPAWPRQVHVVPQVPVTAVGKIFKPSLRQDAVDCRFDAIIEATGAPRPA